MRREQFNRKHQGLDEAQAVYIAIVPVGPASTVGVNFGLD